MSHQIRLDDDVYERVKAKKQPGESFSDAVGWFTQSQIHLSPDQVAHLKGVLGPAVPAPASRASQRASAAAAHPAAEEPAILKLPSVLAG